MLHLMIGVARFASLLVQGMNMTTSVVVQVAEAVVLKILNFFQKSIDINESFQVMKKVSIHLTKKNAYF